MCIYMCVSVCVCVLHVCMYVCMYVCNVMYVCMYVNSELPLLGLATQLILKTATIQLLPLFCST